MTLVKVGSRSNAGGRPIFCETGMKESTGWTGNEPVDGLNESDFASRQCFKFNRGRTELLQDTRGLLLCQNEEEMNKTKQTNRYGVQSDVAKIPDDHRYIILLLKRAVFDQTLCLPDRKLKKEFVEGDVFNEFLRCRAIGQVPPSISRLVTQDPPVYVDYIV